MFLAGDPTLDFLNTVPVVQGEAIDLLSSSKEVVRWLEASEMVSKRDAAQLARRFGGDDVLRATAVTLREPLRDIVEARLDGRRCGERSLKPVNALLALPAASLRLDADLKLVRSFQPASMEAVLAPLAEQAARFLADADVSLLRRCGNAQCVLYFYDTSKNHQRRWCSMKLCGNRLKVAEYRRRREH